MITKKASFLTLALASISLLIASPASAITYTLNPGYWSGNPVNLTVYDVSNYAVTAQRATTSWNGIIYKVNLIYTRTQPAYNQIQIASKSHVEQWIGSTSITLADGSVKQGDNTSNWDPSLAYSFAWCEMNERTISYYGLTENQRQSSIAHEVGHALAIGHDSDKTAVMYPSTNGTGVTPNISDQAALTKKYMNN